MNPDFFFNPFPLAGVENSKFQRLEVDPSQFIPSNETGIFFCKV